MDIRPFSVNDKITKSYLFWLKLNSQILDQSGSQLGRRSVRRRKIAISEKWPRRSYQKRKKKVSKASKMSKTLALKSWMWWLTLRTHKGQEKKLFLQIFSKAIFWINLIWYRFESLWGIVHGKHAKCCKECFPKNYICPITPLKRSLPGPNKGEYISRQNG